MLMSSSLAHRDYAVSKPAERPVIKKLVDNLQVSGGQLEAKPSLRTDYPEFEVKRPVIHRLVDQLKTSGQSGEGGDFTATTTLSRDQYRPLSVKRPEGGRKLRSSLKVRGQLDAVSTSRSQYQVFICFYCPPCHYLNYFAYNFLSYFLKKHLVYKNIQSDFYFIPTSTMQRERELSFKSLELVKSNKRRRASYSCPAGVDCVLRESLFDFSSSEK